MHRILSFTMLNRNNLQNYCVGSSNIYSELKTRSIYCTFCGNVWKKQTIKGEGTRLQSTKAVLRKSLKKKEKSKKSPKYVELLEVKGADTTETQASVSKFKAKHLSRLISNEDISLGELHKLNNSSKPKKNSQEIDSDLHKEIENVVLNKYKKSSVCDLSEDDSAIIFASQVTPDSSLFKTNEGILSIKESFNRFRKETVKKQKMKDIVLAINEGLNQSENIDKTANNGQVQTKTRQENYKEIFSRLESVGQNLEKKRIHVPDHLTETCSDIHYSEGDGIDLNHVESDKPKKKSKAQSVSQTTMKEKLSSEQLSVLQTKEFQMKTKEFSLNKLLECHLNVSVYAGNLEKALQILNHFRRRGLRQANHPKITSVNIYNILLRGYAAKGDYSTICNILGTMKLDNLNLNAESFAAIFECLNRSTVDDKLSLLNRFKEQMDSSGISLNNLLDGCRNSREQANHVIAAIRIIDPSFVYRCDKSDKKYEGALVEELNSIDDLCTKNNITQYLSPAEGLFTLEDLMKRSSIQIENEEHGTISIRNIMDDGKPSEKVLQYRKMLEDWEEDSKKKLHKSFLHNLFALKSQANSSHNPLNIVPYLSLLKVGDYVDIMMIHIMKLANGSETYSPTARQVQKDLGNAVNMQYKILRKTSSGLKDKILSIYNDYCAWYLHREKSNVCSEKFNSRRVWEHIVHKHMDGISLDAGNLTWPTSVCVCVGQFLHNIVMNDINIDVNMFSKKAEKRKLVPAFYGLYRAHGYFKKSEIKPHPLLVKLVAESARPTLLMETPLVPSLCPPLPWTSPVSGGYLITETTVMRLLMGAVSQLKLLESAPPQSLYPCFDSLNQLGSIPWKVNKPILDIMIKVFRNGGCQELKIYPPSSSLVTTVPIKSKMSKKEKSLAYRLKIQLSRQKKEMHSLWCDLLYKLSLANHHRDMIFWLPHNIDFRGRTYPCPPHLSHLGSDIPRAIMMFAKGMPLGPNGLTWLKLQCINLTGTMKKCTIQERLDFFEANVDKILDSADNPWDGERWWAQSEDPWQTLACCMEIANALRSPNHEEYLCHIPVHQDGSCNGLQHYAALGRDEAGAFSVNLFSADRPQDVYSAVVKLVEENRMKDAANGVEIAKILEGFIQRKVIKQTIMTTVYGVTKFGARLQIAKKLKDINDFPKEHIWAASFYLTRRTFDSLSEMFTSTKLIQDWFTDLARLMSSVHNDKTEWITPLGLPIVQPYHTPSKSSYNSKNTLMEYQCYDETEKSCTMKQKNAFPPNFIHSLDASHMMLTSLYSEANNITFVSVHDCFWTHAATVEVMNRICREQFVGLHSQPILEDLSKHLMNKYETSLKLTKSKNKSHQELLQLLKTPPKRGQFDLKNVLKSTYFFS